MLTFSNVFCRRGEKVILDGVSFTIHAKQHVGLVGANGAGKSSLFALIRGQLLPEDGDVSSADRLRLAHLAQQTPSSERSALDFALDGDRELRRIQGALARAEDSTASSTPSMATPRKPAPEQSSTASAFGGKMRSARSTAFPAVGACAWPWPRHS